MKKLCLVLLVNFLVFNALAQNKEHKEYFDNNVLKVEGFKNENGIKTGEWKTYHENGKLKDTGNFLEGIKKGEWKTYYANGQLKNIGNILDGLKTGKWTYYDQNGKLQSEDDQLKRELDQKGELIKMIKGKGKTVEMPLTEIEFRLRMKENDAKKGEDREVPFSIIENPPIYPGCESGNSEDKRKCMSSKISAFVNENFNTKIGKEIGLSGRQRINVIFKIDTKGNIVKIRSRAPHPKLEEEAIRVINLLPKMIPGKQRGEVVIVPYSLPILFQI